MMSRNGPAVATRTAGGIPETRREDPHPIEGMGRNWRRCVHRDSRRGKCARRPPIRVYSLHYSVTPLPTKGFITLAPLLSNADADNH